MAVSLHDTVGRLGDGVGGTPAQKRILSEHLRDICFAANEVVTSRRATDVRLTDADTIEPMTARYPSGPVIILPEPRTYTKLPVFTGDNSKPHENVQLCLDWLRRVVAIARQKTLSHATALEFMIEHSSGNAGTIIRGAQDDGKDFYRIVLDLEMNFCLLKHPELALEECRKLRRAHREPLQQFAERIRHLAAMAYRHKPPNEKDVFSKAAMTESFRNSLPPKIRSILSERITSRIKQGLPALAYSDLVQEAVTIDQEKSAHDTLYESRIAANGNGNVRAIAEEEYDPDEEASISSLRDHLEEAFADDDEDRSESISRILQTRRNNPRRPGPPTQQRQPGGFARKPANQKANIHQIDSYQIEEDGYCYLAKESNGRFKRTRVSASAVNVTMNECLKCGMSGHYAFGPSAATCPLAKQPLLQTPCASCKKGGHLPAHCPQTLDLVKN
jgi:hypothetical protein